MFSYWLVNADTLATSHAGKASNHSDLGVVSEHRNGSHGKMCFDIIEATEEDHFLESKKPMCLRPRK